MSYLLSAAYRKAVDAYTINEYGISGEELVEAAARALEKEIITRFENAKVMIVCGYGNNGADGLALARMLSLRKYEVEIRKIGNPSKATELYKYEEKLLPASVWEKPAEAPICCDIVVDAMFGIGLNRDIQGQYLEIVNRINEYKKISGPLVVAADIPSGINADSGQVLGGAVDADLTVAMQYACPGHILYPGTEKCGKLIVADIGIRNITEAGIVPTAYTEYEAELPSHKNNSHKGNYGRLYMLVGSSGMAGAACMSAESAYRIGAGLVYVDSPDNITVLQIKVPEAVLMPWREAEKQGIVAAVAGCGLGKDQTSKGKLYSLLREFDGPLVLDADALNMVSEDEELAQLVKEHRDVILTPHVGEAARLLNKTTKEIMIDLPGAAALVAEKYSAVCTLKAARTVVAVPGDGPYFLNTYGNPGMSTAGSGDVLAGIIGGLLARGLTPESAAVLGVLSHAKAGDIAAEKLGMSHMLARDIISCLSEITNKWR